jgi:hypothetical protein
MAAKARCIIITSYADTGAYGVRTDNDDRVFFPFSLAESLELEEFDEVEAILIQNDRADPPWKALRARRLKDSG